MELSIFLAKLLGIYLLIIAVELLLRKHDFQGAVKDYASSKGLIALSGSVSLMFGITIALLHPVYELNWQGLITLIAYLMILKGILRVGFSSRFQKKILPRFEKCYAVMVILFLVVGVYLTYSGFNAVMPQ